MKLLLQHGIFALCWAAAFAQPVFEVASVKASPSDSTARSTIRGGPGLADPGQFIGTNVTLASALLRAYNVKSYQVSGPDWVSSRRYDIAAKVPPDTTKEQFEQMLQTLLAERFRLALHHETREIQGFDLIAGRGGSKLKPSSEQGPPQPELTAPPKTDPNGFPILDGPGLLMMEGVRGKAVVTCLTARAQPLSALVEILSREFRLPIADKTGLTDKFDFQLEFAPQPPGALPPADAADESAPNLITAVQQQLGLRLSPAKVPLDVVVIDRANQVPTEN